MMDKYKLWEAFENTGDILAYLKYKQEEDGAFPLNKDLEYTDKRNCHREEIVGGERTGIDAVDR